MKINEKIIIKQFWNYSNCKIIIPNTKFFRNFESDMIMIKDKMIYEFEIKLSISDYMNDFKHKKIKHKLYMKGNEKIPNFFYFIMPKGMIQKDGIPEKYGLIEFENFINNNTSSDPILTFEYTKKAKLLNNEKLTYEQLIQLMTSLCWKLHK